jgi:hypothetical protein
MWQDYVISAGQVAFVVALVPSIFSGNKPAAATSFMTAIILTSFVFCFASMGLFFSVITSCLAALAWWILFYQVAHKRYLKKVLDKP